MLLQGSNCDETSAALHPGPRPGGQGRRCWLGMTRTPVPLLRTRPAGRPPAGRDRDPLAAAVVAATTTWLLLLLLLEVARSSARLRTDTGADRPARPRRRSRPRRRRPRERAGRSRRSRPQDCPPRTVWSRRARSRRRERAKRPLLNVRPGDSLWRIATRTVHRDGDVHRHRARPQSTASTRPTGRDRPRPRPHRAPAPPAGPDTPPRRGRRMTPVAGRGGTRHRHPPGPPPARHPGSRGGPGDAGPGPPAGRVSPPPPPSLPRSTTTPRRPEEADGTTRLRDWAARLAQAAVETAAGQRPVSQLVRWTAPEVYADLDATRPDAVNAVSGPQESPHTAPGAQPPPLSALAARDRGQRARPPRRTIPGRGVAPGDACRPLDLHGAAVRLSPPARRRMPGELRGGHPDCRDGLQHIQERSGGVLLSHNLSVAVPSALTGLTSGFGMGPGVSLSLWPP